MRRCACATSCTQPQSNADGSHLTMRTPSRTNRRCPSGQPFDAEHAVYALKHLLRTAKTSRLTVAGRLLDSGAHGVAQDPGRGTDSFARSAHGGPETSERH